MIEGPEDLVKQHLANGTSTSRDLYARFIEVLGTIGPFTVHPAKTSITFKGTRRGFCGAHPKGEKLIGYFDLMRKLPPDPRLGAVSAYTKTLYVHHFRITSLDQLNEEFQGWLREAYAVGQGAHLRPSATQLQPNPMLEGLQVSQGGHRIAPAASPSITVKELAKWLAIGRPVQLLDVRRAPAFEKNPKTIRGAERVLPESVQLWSTEREITIPIVAYCVYGHEVSQGAVAELIMKGLNASFLVGGITEWERQGNPTFAVDA